MKSFKKDPASTLDYGVDWSRTLATGEVISTSQWTVPTGLTQAGPNFDNTTTVVYISGGQPNRSYTVKNVITTSANPVRTDARSFRLKVETL